MVFFPFWTSAAVFRILEKREVRGEKEREERRGEAMGGEGEEERRAGIAPPGLQSFPIKAAGLLLFPLGTLVSESPLAQVIIPAG